MSEKELKPTKIYPWIVLWGISLLTATGVCTVLANASLFIPSILMETGWNVSEFVIWITCYNIGVAIAMTYAGSLWTKIPTPVLLTVCIVVSMVCFALFGFCNAIWQYYILGGIIGLVGGVYFIVAAPFVIPNWFAKHAGLALGIGGALAAIQTAILTPIQSAIIAALGWRMGYVGVAALSLVIALPFALFIIRFKPADKGMLPYGYDPEDEKSKQVAAAGTDNAPGVPLVKAVKNPIFICLVVAAGLASILSGFGSLWNNIGLTWGYDEAFGASMVAAAALFGVLNPIIGVMIDKIKASGATIFVFAVVFVAALLLLFVHNIGPVVLVGVFLFAWYGGLTVSCIPYMALQFFGPKAYTKLCSYIQIGVSVLGALSAPIIGLFFDTTGSYDNAFFMAIAICIIGVLIVFFCLGQSKKLVWEDAEPQAEKTSAAAAE